MEPIRALLLESDLVGEEAMLTFMGRLYLAFLLPLARATPFNFQTSPSPEQATNCPLYLPANNFEFPHLIVPISAASPDAAIGNAFTPAISPNDIATIFDFDIPISRAQQTCSLYFSLPYPSQLITTSFSYSGPGTFQFVQYQDDVGASPRTTWNTQPALSNLPPAAVSQVAPGHSYKIWTGNCGQGGLLSWRMSSSDSCLWYFQDFNDCAIGLYIVYE